MARLDDELGNFGCGWSAEEFREFILELKALTSPAWTDEELTYHPDDAKDYCRMVRSRTQCATLPDHFILRSLINCRKSGLN